MAALDKLKPETWIWTLIGYVCNDSLSIIYVNATKKHNINIRLLY